MQKFQTDSREFEISKDIVNFRKMFIKIGAKNDVVYKKNTTTTADFAKSKLKTARQVDTL